MSSPRENMTVRMGQVPFKREDKRIYGESAEKKLDAVHIKLEQIQNDIRNMMKQSDTQNTSHDALPN